MLLRHLAAGARAARSIFGSDETGSRGSQDRRLTAAAGSSPAAAAGAAAHAAIRAGVCGGAHVLRQGIGQEHISRSRRDTGDRTNAAIRCWGFAQAEVQCADARLELREDCQSHGIGPTPDRGKFTISHARNCPKGRKRYESPSSGDMRSFPAAQIKVYLLEDRLGMARMRAMLSR